MTLLAGIQAHFHQLLPFQEVTQPLILVYSWCYSWLLGQHSSQFSILHFVHTLYHHNMFALLCTSADHSWWCLLSCKITISPTFKFLLVFVHFFLSWSDCKNSFLQPLQNSFTVCWTHVHLLWLYNSGLEKSPEGGKIIFDFMVKRFDGDGQTTGRIANAVSCQRSGIQDSLCLCH